METRLGYLKVPTRKGEGEGEGEGEGDDRAGNVLWAAMAGCG